MKIRKGFVSNSSSSSFVLVTTKENHEKALETLNEVEREIIGILTGEEKVFGKVCVVFDELTVHGDSSNDLENLEIPEALREKCEDLYDAFFDAEEKWKSEVRKDKENCWVSSIDA